MINGNNNSNNDLAAGKASKIDAKNVLSMRTRSLIKFVQWVANTGNKSSEQAHTSLIENEEQLCYETTSLSALRSGQLILAALNLMDPFQWPLSRIQHE